MSIGAIAIIAFLTIIIWIGTLIFGIFLCQKNNALGIFLLLIAINIFGIVLGICIIWNNLKFEERELSNIKQEKRYHEKVKKLQDKNKIINN